jgi:hypothetical protein
MTLIYTQAAPVVFTNVEILSGFYNNPVVWLGSYEGILSGNCRSVVGGDRRTGDCTSAEMVALKEESDKEHPLEDEKLRLRTPDSSAEHHEQF